MSSLPRLIFVTFCFSCFEAMAFARRKRNDHVVNDVRIDSSNAVAQRELGSYYNDYHMGNFHYYTASSPSQSHGGRVPPRHYYRKSKKHKNKGKYDKKRVVKKIAEPFKSKKKQKYRKAKYKVLVLPPSHDHTHSHSHTYSHSHYIDDYYFSSSHYAAYYSQNYEYQHYDMNHSQYAEPQTYYPYRGGNVKSKGKGKRKAKVGKVKHHEYNVFDDYGSKSKPDSNIDGSKDNSHVVKLYNDDYYASDDYRDEPIVEFFTDDYNDDFFVKSSHTVDDYDEPIVEFVTDDYNDDFLSYTADDYYNDPIVESMSADDYNEVTLFGSQGDDYYLVTSTESHTHGLEHKSDVTLSIDDDYYVAPSLNSHIAKGKSKLDKVQGGKSQTDNKGDDYYSPLLGEDDYYAFFPTDSHVGKGKDHVSKNKLNNVDDVYMTRHSKTHGNSEQEPHSKSHANEFDDQLNSKSNSHEIKQQPHSKSHAKEFEEQPLSNSHSYEIKQQPHSKSHDDDFEQNPHSKSHADDFRQQSYSKSHDDDFEQQQHSKSHGDGIQQQSVVKTPMFENHNSGYKDYVVSTFESQGSTAKSHHGKMQTNIKYYDYNIPHVFDVDNHGIQQYALLTMPTHDDYYYADDYYVTNMFNDHAGKSNNGSAKEKDGNSGKQGDDYYIVPHFESHNHDQPSVVILDGDDYFEGDDFNISPTLELHRGSGKSGFSKQHNGEYGDSSKSDEDYTATIFDSHNHGFSQHGAVVVLNNDDANVEDDFHGGSQQESVVILNDENYYAKDDYSGRDDAYYRNDDYYESEYNNVVSTIKSKSAHVNVAEVTSKPLLDSHKESSTNVVGKNNHNGVAKSNKNKNTHEITNDMYYDDNVESFEDDDYVDDFSARKSKSKP